MEVLSGEEERTYRESEENHVAPQVRDGQAREKDAAREREGVEGELRFGQVTGGEAEDPETEEGKEDGDAGAEGQLSFRQKGEGSKLTKSSP